eukprot:gb/GFBE01071170.1/.p1 GENE.gb/GFBE01071170.1/~~gb/GFBE01071170.1/.p1  ORF type:complete len:153 (+),score=19.63 gb/GFBE01071170.1/:1-459(+)
MGDPHVSFGDVNWMEERFNEAFGQDQGAGRHGWPMIRYFNKATGYGGKHYKQKTNQEVDAELGDEQRMRDYVQEKSGTSLCNVVWGNECSEMELKYIGKFVGHNIQRDRNSMQREKERWEGELQKGQGIFAQNKQRAVILGRLLDNFDNPEL